MSVEEIIISIVLIICLIVFIVISMLLQYAWYGDENEGQRERNSILDLHEISSDQTIEERDKRFTERKKHDKWL